MPLLAEGELGAVLARGVRTAAVVVAPVDHQMVEIGEAGPVENFGVFGGVV